MKFNRIFCLARVFTSLHICIHIDNQVGVYMHTYVYLGAHMHVHVYHAYAYHHAHTQIDNISYAFTKRIYLFHIITADTFS